MKVILHRDFPFLKQWKMLHAVKEGDPMLSRDVRGVIDALCQGLHPARISEFSVFERGDAVAYALGDGHALVALRAGTVVAIYAVGTSAWVRQWLESHSGVRMLVSTRGETLQLLVRGDVAGSDFESREAEESFDRQIPLLPRITGVDWRKEIDHRGIVRRLLAFSPGQDIAELRQVLDDLRAHSKALADLLTTVFFYLMEDRAAEAQAAVQEHFGPDQAIELAEQPGALGDISLRDGIDPEQIVVVNDLTQNELDRVLDPIRFQDWMQFLEREQKKIVDEDYDHPIVLRGVSGSGKTVVVVHRACRLARANPQSRILTVTLNLDLAELIQNLVKSQPGDDELPTLQTHSFSGYLRELVGVAARTGSETWAVSVDAVQVEGGSAAVAKIGHDGLRIDRFHRCPAAYHEHPFVTVGTSGDIVIDELTEIGHCSGNGAIQLGVDRCSRLAWIAHGISESFEKLDSFIILNDAAVLAVGGFREEVVEGGFEEELAGFLHLARTMMLHL